MMSRHSPPVSLMTSFSAASALIEFWLDAGPTRWFAADAAFDRSLRERFGQLQEQAARSELDTWLGSPDAALALVLLLDQLPRNLYRDSARAFATDGLARSAAAGAVEAGFDRQVDQRLRVFFYLPFEHSESAHDQQRSIDLMTALGDAEYLRYAHAHAECIRRFGRFPYRNEVLGRTTTIEERAWLAQRVPYSGAG